MRRLQKIMLAVCLLGLSGRPGIAQNTATTVPPTPDKPASAAPEAPKPKPTDPAYDGLIAALDLIDKNAALDAALKPNALLFDKQGAVGDPKIKEAVRVLNAWLNQSPIPAQELSYGIGESDPMMMKFGSVLQLAKTLEIKQYVQLADGRVSDAIETTRDGLRLAVALENHSLGGCLEGFAVEDAVILPIAAHLDQLSVSDCYHLMRLSDEWDRTPNAIAFALDRERKALTQTMQKMTGEDGKKLRDMIQKIPADAVKPDTKEGLMIAQMKSLDDTGWLRLMQGMSKGIDTVFSQAVTEMKTPIYNRVEPAPVAAEKSPPAETPPDVVQSLLTTSTAMIKPQLQKMEAEYLKRATYAHLLGCHASIRRFHWENNRWPATLKELKLDALAIDPFSGNTLVYKTDSEGYTLESVGPPVYDAEGKLTKTARTPITLPEKPKPATP